MQTINKPLPVSSRILFDVPCKVCQDHSSGKHYGIFACDGCAGFFKRSIRRSRQYVCKAKGESTCVVDKTHRNQCRACRLVKCIEAGMNKDAVQHERGPRNSTIRRHVALYLKEAEAEASTLVNHGLQRPSSRILSNPGLRPPIFPTTFIGQDTPLSMHQRIPQMASPPVQSIFSLFNPPTSMGGPVMPRLIDASTLQRQEALRLVNSAEMRSPMLCQPTPKYPHELTLNLSAMVGNSENLCEAAARILFMNVRWAKSVPAFTSLPFSDQLLLLEESWRDLFVLGAAQFILPIDTTTLTSNINSAMSEDEAEKKRLLSEIKNFQEIIVKFKQMNVDSAEYTCLRAILLFKTDFETESKASKASTSGANKASNELSQKQLEESEIATSLQDQAQVALSKYINNVYPTQPFRFGKLLLMLPSLKSISPSSIQELFFRRSIGAIPMERLLTDMYKSRDF